MPLVIREEQVKSLLPMSQAILLVEEALRTLAQGNAENRPRQRVRGEGGMLHLMPASLPTRGCMGFKAYTTFHGQARFFFHLFDSRSGEYLAVIEADSMGQIRTGAATGVATKYLALPDAATAGIIGTGWQAQSQLEAICAVRKLQIVRCYSRDVGRREKFAREQSARLGVPIQAVDDPRSAVFDSDIVVTITTSSTPVLSGDWLSKGTHINAAGSNRSQRRELDDQAIRQSGAIYVDSLEQARLEAGDLIAPAQDGLLSWDRVSELGALLAGKAPGRESPDQITLFKSLGIAVEDVAAASWVYEQARAQNVGQEITL